MSTILQLLAGFLTALVIAFEATWLLAIVLFGCFPILATVGYLQITLLKGRTAKNKQLMEESGKTTTEAIDNIRTVASLGVEERFSRQYHEQLLPPFKYVFVKIFKFYV